MKKYFCIAFTIVGSSLLARETKIDYAKVLYSSVNVSAQATTYINVSINRPLVGMQIQRKYLGHILCTKFSAVVPNPAYSYDCYQKAQFTDSTPEALYKSIKEEPLLVKHSPEGVREPKRFQKNTSNGFCMAEENAVGSKQFVYSCYELMTFSDQDTK